MSSIIVRPYDRKDKDEVLNICYKTGFIGDDLAKTGRFNDIKLFGFLFCLYYIRFESENCFVAEDENTHRVIGYICGTENTIKQELAFSFKMGLKIAMRMLFYSSWRFPESFSAVMYFASHVDLRTGIKDFYKLYPAHLHINILPEYQKFGLGTKLLNKFENEMDRRGVKGIHLRTSNKNFKAYPFYLKNNYTVIFEGEGSAWKGITQFHNVIFAKKLGIGVDNA